MESVPIVGGRDDILASAKKYKIDQILFGNSKRKCSRAKRYPEHL